jgi:hypothetical protein
MLERHGVVVIVLQSDGWEAQASCRSNANQNYGLGTLSRVALCNSTMP